MKSKLLLLLLLVLLFAARSRAGNYPNEALSNTPILVAAGSYSLTGWNLTGLANAPCYLHFYDASSAGAVTVGTTTQVYMIPVAQTGYTILYPGPVYSFTSGIVVAVTTSPLSSGTTAPSTALVAQLQYR